LPSAANSFMWVGFKKILVRLMYALSLYLWIKKSKTEALITF
jgi:hypothetical protein